MNRVVIELEVPEIFDGEFFVSHEYMKAAYFLVGCYSRAAIITGPPVFLPVPSNNRKRDAEMDRRSFIKKAGVAVGAGAAATTLAAPAIAQKRKEMVIVASWGRDFPGLGTGAQRLAKRIETMTDGAIKVQYFAATEGVGAFDVFGRLISPICPASVVVHHSGVAQGEIRIILDRQFKLLSRLFKTLGGKALKVLNTQ